MTEIDLWRQNKLPSIHYVKITQSSDASKSLALARLKRVNGKYRNYLMFFGRRSQKYVEVGPNRNAREGILILFSRKVCVAGTPKPLPF